VGCGATFPVVDGILRLTSRSEGPAGYDAHYFSTLPQVEDAHFWFLARREVILDGIRRAVPDLARRPLFDVGCGAGGLLAFLASRGVPLAGACDAHAEGLAVARRRLEVPLVLVDEGRLPPLASGQAMVSLFDVLEHLDDDRGALAWIRSRLEPGGILVLTVPAHPKLFDEADRLAFHRRRYRRGELERKLRAAGFEVRRLTHFMAPLFPLMLVVRPLMALLAPGDGRDNRDRELRVQPLANGVMRAVLRLERAWLRAFSLPFGTSLLAVAARPMDAPG